jgi:hypothetical protein
VTSPSPGERSVLVVVTAMGCVTMVPVEVVVVVVVGDGRVPAAGPVDVHVADVNDVEISGLDRGSHLAVHDVVDLPVVQEVDVVVVGHGRMSAEAVMGVRVIVEGEGRRIAHRRSR